MNIAANSEPRIVTLEVTEDSIVAQFADGRAVSVPLAWSWRLANATPAQRRRFEIIGTGEGVHWPDIDEDLSADGMLNGVPARRPEKAKPRKPASASQALQPTSRARKRAKAKVRSRAARG